MNKIKVVNKDPQLERTVKIQKGPMQSHKHLAKTRKLSPLPLKSATVTKIDTRPENYEFKWNIYIFYQYFNTSIVTERYRSTQIDSGDCIKNKELHKFPELYK